MAVIIIIKAQPSPQRQTRISKTTCRNHIGAIHDHHCLYIVMQYWSHWNHRINHYSNTAIIISYSYNSQYCNRHSYSYTTITIHILIAILATKAITFMVQSYRAAAHAPLLSPDAKYFPLESNATDVTVFVWPFSSATCCCAATSQILTVQSLEPVKKRGGMVSSCRTWTEILCE